MKNTRKKEVKKRGGGEGRKEEWTRQEKEGRGGKVTERKKENIRHLWFISSLSLIGCSSALCSAVNQSQTGCF